MIAQYEWDTLDFGVLAAETASKLTDDDLAKILTLIKAKDNLKTLKLTGCAGIVGSGLKPLSKSTVLQEMDLHFFDRHNVYKSEKYNMHKTWQKSMMLDEATVVPILSSMLPPNVLADLSSLLLVRYPKHWRERKSAILTGFLQVFDGVLKNRNYLCCSNDCDLPCRDEYPDEEEVSDNEGDFMNLQGKMYGTSDKICTRCKETFCHQNCFVQYCERCEQHTCMDCCPTEGCDECNEITCIDCTNIEMCDSCGKTTCGDCCPVFWCEHCEMKSCIKCEPTMLCSREKCSNQSCESCDKVWSCAMCHHDFCFECVVPNSCFDLGGDGAIMFCDNVNCICDCGECDGITMLGNLHEWDDY